LLDIGNILITSGFELQLKICAIAKNEEERVKIYFLSSRIFQSKVLTEVWVRGGKGGGAMRHSRGGGTGGRAERTVERERQEALDTPPGELRPPEHIRKRLGRSCQTLREKKGFNLDTFFIFSDPDPVPYYPELFAGSRIKFWIKN